MIGYLFCKFELECDVYFNDVPQIVMRTFEISVPAKEFISA